jgi:7-carboxy-7-deazaguanine synthase
VPDNSLRKLRVLELYYSVQGEGPRVGTPTIFVRFAGCNLKCPGWPCDTPYAIKPELFTKEQELYPCGALAERVSQMCRETGATNVCLTGGEPLLQHTGTLFHFVADLHERNRRHVEMFSNGTLSYETADWPRWWFTDHVEVVMDWKLPGSGEAIPGEAAATRLANLNLLREYTNYYHAVKFTIADEADLMAAKEVWSKYLSTAGRPPVYVGPVWGKFEAEQIVEFLRDNKLPWKLNLQTHKYIWDPDERYT